MDLSGPIHEILAVFLGAVLILGGLGVVLFTNPIYSALELILNLVNINLVTFFYLFDSRQLKGDIFSIFVIAITVAEVAIGLAIISSIHHNIKSTRINQSNLLNN